MKAKARFVTLFGIAAVGLTSLFSASALAGYSPSSLSVGSGKAATSVAVNQTSQDLYVASYGTQSLGSLQAGEVKRFPFGGGEETCASYPTNPYSAAVDPANGHLYLVTTASAGGAPRALRTFNSACGSQIGEFALSAFEASNPVPQPAADSNSNIYYPNNATSNGKVEVFESSGASKGLTHPIEGLAKPDSVSLDSAGNIYVVEPRGGTNEVQTVELQGSSVPGGTFNLTFAGETVSNISATESAVNLKNKLLALPKIGTNNVAVTATGSNPQKYTITFQAALGLSDVPQITCDGTNLTPAGATCAEATTTPGVSTPGHLFKYAGFAASPNDGQLLETFFTGDITTATVDQVTGNVFIGSGYGGTGYPGKGFHVEKYSSAGVKLADFGDGQFTSSANFGIVFQHLAVNKTSGVVYAANGAVGKVQVFTPATLSKSLLKVEKTGSGAASGKVTSDIAGINCGSGVACEHEYEEGELITLTAQGEGGATFVNWEECPEVFGASGEKCRVMVTAAKTVSAEFNAPAGQTLKVIKEGTGSGTVTSSQSGLGSQQIDCGSHCEETFSNGTLVALSASPAAHSTFSGWSVTGDASACPGVGICEVTLSASKEVHATFTEQPFNFSVNTAGGTGTGSVKCDGGPCAASYAKGTVLTMTVVPDTHNSFNGWSVTGDAGTTCTGITTPCTITVNADISVSAPFDQITHSFSLNTSGGTGTGVVQCNGGACASSYPEGTALTMTETPDTHNAFAGWSVTGDAGTTCTGITTPCTITVEADISVSAPFNLIKHNLTINTTSGSGSGSVQCDTGGGPEACKTSYDEGTEVTISQSASFGSEFKGWTGCDSEPSGNCKVTLSTDKSVSATFDVEPGQKNLNINKTGDAESEVKCKVGAGSFGPCSPSYPEGTSLTLEAIAGPHATFSGWSGGTGSALACTGTANCSFTISADSSVDAPFPLTQRTLTTAKNGTGDGSFECKTTGSFGACQASYADGETITVKAVPNASSTFVSWTGCSSTSANECTVSAINANTTVTATFNLAQRSLTVTKAGTGNGSFTCDTGSGPVACAASYPDGTDITIAATPVAGSSFAGWSAGTGSASCSGTGACVITDIAANSTITGTFTLIQRTLTTAKNGTGDGSFECKTTGSFGACQASYADGETITVKAVPNASSTFVSWAGCSSTSANECTVSSIAANTTVTATFNLIQRTLTVNKGGTGNGSFECDSGSGFGACSSTYADGTSITIKATASAGSTFAGWSGGGCSGTGNCVISNIAADTTVTGTFNLNQSTLTINKTGAGDGSFTCDTGSGPGACQSAYANGTTVTITATPDSHSAFGGWSGSGCTGTGTCVLVLSSNKTVSAAFSLAQRTLTLAKEGSGEGSFQCDTGSGYGPCQASYADGTTLVVRATPDPSSIFTSWAGCDSEPGAGKCAIEDIDADRTLTATFTVIPQPPASEGGGSSSGSAGSPAASSPPPATTTTPPTQKPLRCRKGTKKRMIRGKPKCVKVKRHKRHRHNRHRVTLAELIERAF